MWKKSKARFTERAKNSDGEKLPEPTVKLNECYAKIDTNNYWQGDVYSSENFNRDALPNPTIPYWMLVNRTCHLYKGDGREIKLPFLNFIAVQPACDYARSVNTNLKNAITDLVKSKLEGFLFLPAHPDQDVIGHLVANFNLIYTFSLDNVPDASDKLRQLSSPYCEHVFQRFSRYFYTVGYDDKNIKSNDFIEAIVDECSEN